MLCARFVDAVHKGYCFGKLWVRLILFEVFVGLMVGLVAEIYFDGVV